MFRMVGFQNKSSIIPLCVICALLIVSIADIDLSQSTVNQLNTEFSAKVQIQQN